MHRGVDSVRAVAIAAATLAITVVVSGCGSSDDSSAKGTTTTTAASTAATTTTAASGSGGGQSSSGTSASGPAPTIDTFVTPDDIDCHNGNSQTFSASWTTSNAVKTTISIDGPGVYKPYGPDGSDSLPFDCSSSHSFLLTAYGQDGRTATRTITLQPRNASTTTTSSTANATTTT